MCNNEIEKNGEMCGEFKSEFAVEGCVRLSYSDLAPLSFVCVDCGAEDGMKLVYIDKENNKMGHKCHKCGHFMLSDFWKFEDIEACWYEER